MDELSHLVLDWPHWAFEIIANTTFTAVIFILGSIVPTNWNPAKRWVERHDKEHHGK